MDVKLSPIERQIYEAVAKRPRTTSELMELIWWMHPQDAPQRNNIKAHVWRLNQKLRGERIASRRGTRQEEPYRLIKQ